MFKNLKTSTQISLKFTVFSAIILFFVACFMNFFFFSFWYFDLKNPPFMKNEFFKWPREMMEEVNWLSWNIVTDRGGDKCPNWMCKPDENRHFNPEQNFPQHRLRLNYDSDEAKELLSQKNILNIYVVDWYYLYLQKDWDFLQVNNVTPHVQLQYSLLWISIVILVVGIVLSYIASLFFVKTALKKLNALNDALESLDIDHLNHRIKIEWSKDDEINKVSMKFNQALEKISNQTLWLKDFVRNASHELRTPLMWISTLVDLARKSKNYDESLKEVKEEIKRMDELLDALLLITRIEETVSLDKEENDIVKSLNSTLKQLAMEFDDKKIVLHQDVPSKLVKKVHKQGWESIMTNLLRNAFKYVPNEWEIKVSLNEDCFKVWNSWEWIADENLQKIWERFWQWDSSNSDRKSFWLWLYLSKLFAEKQWFEIWCESEKWKWVTFILKFN